MPRPFFKLSRAEFTSAVKGYAWRQPKTEIHVHHTWRPNHAQYQGERSIVAMWEYHTKVNGWADIAQHVSIAPDGAIWTGRDWNKTPASAVGHNHPGIFMFETIGDFDTGRDPLTGEQLKSVVFVTALIAGKFNIPNEKIKFHNQMSAKTCPGSSLKRLEFLTAVDSEKSTLTPGPEAPEADVRSVLEHLNERTDQGVEGVEAKDLGQAEISHDEALATFMRDFHRNIYLKQHGPETGVEALATASPRERAVEEAITLSKQDEAILLRELGHRAYKLEALPESALQPGLQPETEALEGLRDHFIALGTRIYKRLIREVYAVVCGQNDADTSDRAKLREAFGLGSDAVISALVGILVSGFGLVTAIAAVVAALITKRIIKPAYEETCLYWGEQLKP
jgi:hypothetical protein